MTTLDLSKRLHAADHAVGGVADMSGDFMDRIRFTFRSVMDPAYGAVPDCTQPVQTISLTSGNPNATTNAAVTGLKAGHTIVAGFGFSAAISASTDTLSKTAHGLQNGQAVQLSTLYTTTPGQFASQGTVVADTVYFVVNKTADTFQIAATVGGAALDLTTDGTANVSGSFGNYVVSAVAGTAVTLTANASTTVAAAKFIYGTDNTGAFNAFFPDLIAKKAIGVVPNGYFLHTGTIGILEPGNAAGVQGLTVIWGGAANNSMRFSNLGLRGGTSLIWGGAAGGTMMQFSRVSYLNFIGGASLVGQASYDPSGFVTFGPRAGIGFHFSQNSTPLVGTGYMTLGDFAFEDMAQAMQFATNALDNNCDTSLINRLVVRRCSNGDRIMNAQGLSYRFNWVHYIGVPGYCHKSDSGGAVEWGSVHLSACGTASTGGQATDTYCIDIGSTYSGYVHKIAILRVESNTVRVAAVREDTTHLQIDLFEEANSTNQDRTMFFMFGGTIDIQGGRIASFLNTTETPFYFSNDTNSRPPCLSLIRVARQTQDWSKLFSFNANCIPDISDIGPRNDSNTAYTTRFTRLERGRVLLGVQSSDATTAKLLDPLWGNGGTSYVFARGPRLPSGRPCVLNVTYIGDHGGGVASIFQRRYVVYRAGSGTAVVLDTATIGTDIVQGTDQVLAPSLGTTTRYTFNPQVQGTAATNVNWRATVDMVGDPNLASPDV